MASDKRITDLTALTTPADGDLLPIVDISDTTDASSGTTKKIAWSNVQTPWQNWTPTFENFTKGSASIIAKYKTVGKTVHYSLQISYAADSVMGTNPTFSLPVTAVSPGYGDSTSVIGRITIIDQGDAFFDGVAIFASTTTAYFKVLLVDSVYAKQAYVTSGVPMTWANTDYISVTGTYEAA
jgi:hypothetical protein